MHNADFIGNYPIYHPNSLSLGRAWWKLSIEGMEASGRGPKSLRNEIYFLHESYNNII